MNVEKVSESEFPATRRGKLNEYTAILKQLNVGEIIKIESEYVAALRSSFFCSATYLKIKISSRTDETHLFIKRVA